jgi:hypothetical protein
VYRWCRRCTVLMFAVVVFGTVIAAIVLARTYTDSGKVQRMVQRFFLKSTESAVGMRSVNIGPQGATFEDIEVHRKDSKGNNQPVLTKGDLSVGFDGQALAGGQLKVRKATLSNAEFKFHFDKDGRCAAFTFRRAQDETKVTDPISLDLVNGTIHSTFEFPSAPALTFTDVSGKIEFVPNRSVGLDLKATTNGCDVKVRASIDMLNRTAKVETLTVNGAPLGRLLASLPPSVKGSLAAGVFALGKADLVGSAEVGWKDDQPRVAGRIAATMHQDAGRTCLKSARLEGSYDARTGILEVADASLIDADLSASLPLVPEEHRGKIGSPETLQGTVKIAAKGKVRTKEKPFGWEGKATAELMNASWSPPQSPFPISKASAFVEVTPEGLAVHRAEAAVGPIQATAKGMLPDWDCQQARLDFTAMNVPFAKEIRDRLPPKERELWDKFQPEGSASATGEAAMNGGKPRFVGVVTFDRNAFTYEKFPYRVTGVGGRADFHPDGRVTLDMACSCGGASGTLKGSLSDLTPTSEMELTIAATDVQIDDELRCAFAPIRPAAEPIAKVHATGRGSGVVQLKRRQGSRLVRVETDVDLDLRDFRADWFPYLLDRVTGKIRVFPDRVEFLNCTGRTRAGAAVRMNGWNQRDLPVGDAGDPNGRSHLHLELLATDAPLDDSLRRSIKPEWRGIWDQLQPEGTLSLTACFDAPPGKEPTIDFRLDGRKAALTPVAFPYRLHDFEGPIEARGKTVVWKNMTCRHGDVVWRSEGGSVSSTERGGELHLDRLHCPRLPFDAELKAAVPPSLRSVMEFLSPSTPAERVHFDDLTVKWSPPGGPPPTFEIGSGKAVFVNADLAPSIGAKNVTGDITLGGVFNRAAEFKGNVYLHSITMAGMKATALQSRISVRGSQIDFEGLQADFYGGRLHGQQIQAVMEPVPEYRATLNVMNASLKDFVKQSMNSEMNLDSVISSALTLHGRGTGIGRLNGHGTLDMREVDLERLPILLDQLNFIVRKLPEGKMFDHLRVEFNLDGPRMLVNDLKMSSPTIGFRLQQKSTGVIDLSTGTLDLDMVSELSRSGWRLPILTPATAFHVGGTYTDPRIQPVPWSGLRKSLTPASRRRE